MSHEIAVPVYHNTKITAGEVVMCPGSLKPPVDSKLYPYEFGRPRGICAVCHRSVSAKKSGIIWEHS